MPKEAWSPGPGNCMLESSTFQRITSVLPDFERPIDTPKQIQKKQYFPVNQLWPEQPDHDAITGQLGWVGVEPGFNKPLVIVEYLDWKQKKVQALVVLGGPKLDKVECCFPIDAELSQALGYPALVIHPAPEQNARRQTSLSPSASGI